MPRDTMLNFKVWDTHNRRFLEGYKELLKYFHGFCNMPDNPKSFGLSFWKVPDGYFKVIKSMEKNDKNGDEIFAGDIVSHSTWCTNPEEPDKLLPCLYEIFYDKLRGFWAFIPLQPVIFNGFKTEDCVIVGHRLTNPELLRYLTEDMVETWIGDNNLSGSDIIQLRADIKRSRKYEDQ